MMGAASSPSEVDEAAPRGIRRRLSCLQGERKKDFSSSVRIYGMHRIDSVHTHMLQHRSSSSASPTHRSTILSRRRRWWRWAGN